MKIRDIFQFQPTEFHHSDAAAGGNQNKRDAHVGPSPPLAPLSKQSAGPMIPTRPEQLFGTKLKVISRLIRSFNTQK
jgi:hypothetical protein